MDELIGLAIIVSIAIVAGAICGLVALVQLNTLKQEVAVLKLKLLQFESNQNVAKNEKSSADPQVDNAIPLNRSDIPAAVNKPVSIKPPPPRKTITKKPSSIELLFKQLRAGFEKNWMTWIGAIALALGGVFLAKYSLEAGLLSPAMRLSAGGLFGIGLIAAAYYLHYKRIVFEGFNNYIPAALASGGFMTCFALMFLAYNSFSMLSAEWAFIGLAVIAVCASVMAIKLGPLLAVIGIIGAYSVPIWVNTGSGQLFSLLIYVALVSVAAAVVAHKVKRIWLWYLLWVGHIGWYLVGLTLFNYDTVWLIGAFALLSILGLIAIARLGLGFNTLEVRPHSFKRLVNLFPDHGLLLAFIAPLMIAMLLSVFNLQWQIVALLSIALLLFLVLKNSRWDAWQAVSLLIALLLVVSAKQTYAFNDALFIFKNEYGLGLLLALGLSGYGLYFGNKYPKRLAFHLLASLSMFALVGTLYAMIPNTALATAYPLWAVLLCLMSAVLIKFTQNNTTLWQRFSYWVGANANITLAITMLLSDSGLTIALAVQVLLLSLLIKKYNVAMPHWPIKALVAALLLRLTLSPWTPSYDELSIFGLHWSLVVYPLCIGLFFAAAKCFNTSKLKIWLEGAALHCLALFVTTETSYQLVGHYPQLFSLSFYEQVLLSCNLLALGCVYLYRAQSAGQLGKLYRTAGFILSALAGLLLINTTLDDNPLLMRLYVGETPIFNWILLIWLVPSLLALWLASLVKPLNAKLSQITLGVSGLLALLAINSLIRQYWQGGFIYLDKATSDAELYSYSVIWLLLGALVVIAGHLKQQRLLQNVGLGILGAVIVKVFLIDMANLTGLLKALSFIGLGLSLVGLSWLFQKLRERIHS
ncbi:DUF2339 domain-containing protein [Pseudoalteromonas sp. Scap03]|uniref:DUF2339 domain-containing protein n=1 Tax=unclassified Pseudoalteromonas TaxID=194690 RepID=UPI0015BCD088|nr:MULTISPECIES: DUF2339 domain-containing protein [unclassified Pseudoalteromonas]NWL14274.1 DUF2339 domain-containing protein [Pseudoalteromonas sp. Scap03]QLE82292.1 DUF2339 domain-containing protein [Pseudoalteromonas sp. Scap25]QLE90234.1 DUF2339 domain-containing protein [Pseudoalteromonas sp. Scap06]